jgi:hypothetical protein
MNVSLLNVCGTSAIASICGTIAPPLQKPACLMINKGSVVVTADVAAAAKGFFRRGIALIPLHVGQSTVDLTGYRTLFVAYKDGLGGPTGLVLFVDPHAQQLHTTLTLNIVGGGMSAPPVDPTHMFLNIAI